MSILFLGAVTRRPYLATIQLLLHQRFKTVAIVHWGALRCRSLSQEVFPHASSLVWGQIIILDLEVYPAGNGRIDLFHSVCCEEHDPLVILQGTQEHTDEGISVDIAD